MRRYRARWAECGRLNDSIRLPVYHRAVFGARRDANCVIPQWKCPHVHLDRNVPWVAVGKRGDEGACIGLQACLQGCFLEGVLCAVRDCAVRDAKRCFKLGDHATHSCSQRATTQLRQLDAAGNTGADDRRHGLERRSHRSRAQWRDRAARALAADPCLLRRPPGGRAFCWRRHISPLMRQCRISLGGQWRKGSQGE